MMVFLRADIYGELPSGQKRIRILANNADGISFFTEEKSIIRPENIEEEVNPWIPVTEQMPKEHKSTIPGWGMISKPILVTWVNTKSQKAYPDDRFVAEGFSYNGKIVNRFYNPDYKAVAWKPLPKPAKGVAFK